MESAPTRKPEIDFYWVLLGRLEVRNFIGIASKHVKSLAASIKHNYSVCLASVVPHVEKS